MASRAAAFSFVLFLFGRKILSIFGNKQKQNSKNASHPAATPKTKVFPFSLASLTFSLLKVKVDIPYQKVIICYSFWSL